MSPPLPDDRPAPGFARVIRISSVLRAALPAAILLAGCAGTDHQASGDPVTVQVDPAQFLIQHTGAQRRSKVEVIDIRRTARMGRTALGISLGPIDLRPPAPELIHAGIQAKADEVIERLGVTPAPIVLCGIKIFDITTPSTPVYWDITADIEIVLRMHGQDRTVKASATDRTYVWPSEELISHVTSEALKKLAVESDGVLVTLLSRP